MKRVKETLHSPWFWCGFMSGLVLAWLVLLTVVVVRS